MHSRDDWYWVTMFLKCPNIGLVKDVGQIPFYVGMESGSQAALVSCDIDFAGPFIDDIAPMHIIPLKRILSNETLTGTLFLFKNARKIRWLNLYHCRKENYIWILLYKFLNHKGHVYLKLDASFDLLNRFQNDSNYRALFNKLSVKADIVSAESELMCKLVSQYSSKPIEYIPNGYFETNAVEHVSKENVFLTVARIGAPEKADEDLVNAFVKISDKTDWKLRLVGDVTDAFEDYVNDLCNSRPSLKSRIEIVGPINDKAKLDAEYARAKVFVMPSIYESFCIAIVEAMHNGCKLILSDGIVPAEEFVNGGKNGEIFIVSNIEELASKMLSIAQSEYGENVLNNIKEYARSHYAWDGIAQKLLEMMEQEEAKQVIK